MTSTDAAAALPALIEDGYLSLADLLGRVPEGAWDADSLCEGWRVREVVAHMTVPVRYDQAAFMAELEECGFDFTTLSNKVAARDGALPTEQLVAELRDKTMHNWEPPGGGPEGALTHLVIHSLDVTVPLGEPPASSDQARRTVLDLLTKGGAHTHFGIERIDDSLEATDMDWRFGSGTPRRASSTDILLGLTGRTTPAAR